MSYFNRILKDDEEPIQEIRQHFLVFVKPGLIALGLLLLPFFLMFLLFRWDNIGLVLFIIMVLVGILAMVKLVVIYNNNVLMITNRRIILLKQLGLFDRRISEVDLKKINNVSYRQKGMWQMMFKYGAVRIQLADSKTPLIAANLPRPEELQQQLLRLKENI